jgi:hypothetical protein
VGTGACCGLGALATSTQAGDDRVDAQRTEARRDEGRLYDGQHDEPRLHARGKCRCPLDGDLGSWAAVGADEHGGDHGVLLVTGRIVCTAGVKNIGVTAESAGPSVSTGGERELWAPRRSPGVADIGCPVGAWTLRPGPSARALPICALTRM